MTPPPYCTRAVGANDDAPRLARPKSESFSPGLTCRVGLGPPGRGTTGGPHGIGAHLPRSDTSAGTEPRLRRCSLGNMFPLDATERQGAERSLHNNCESCQAWATPFSTPAGLILAGKLAGMKVGRDWLVVASSVESFVARSERLSLPLGETKSKQENGC